MSKMDINDMFTYDSSTAVKYQAITGDAASAKYLDLGANAKHHFANSAPVFLNIMVNAAFNNLDSLEILFQSDSDSGFATALKEVVVNNIARANLTAGKKIVSFIIPDQAWQRYVRLYFNVVGSNPSTGSLWAWLSNEPLVIDTQIDQVSL